MARTFEIHCVTSTPSTQDEVWRHAAAGAPEGYVAVAEEQTAGRGRLGREWIAPAGSSLLVSVLLRVPTGVAAGVPFVAGLAAVDVLDGLSVTAALKWPNDVLVGGRKLAGILTESRLSSGSGHLTVVLGLGMNLTIDDFPAGIEAVSLHRVLGASPDRDRILDDWLRALAVRLAVLEDAGLPVVLAAWRERAAGLGQEVSVQSLQGTIAGVAEDVADDGTLIVRTAAGLERVLAGDVRIVSTAQG